jgi:hypothetical protein
MNVSTSSVLELHCPQCGYNLRGIDSDVCPECGLAIDRVAFAQSQLPWSHRQRIGRVRGYVRTLAMAMLDSPRLAAEVARPVSFYDAQLFRLITITLAWIPMAAVLAWAATLPPMTIGPLYGRTTRPIPAGFDVYWPLLVGFTTPGVAPIAVAICLLLLSGIASYFFHPKSISQTLQNRAVALSYYACAPLLLVPVGCICIATFFLLMDTAYGQSGRSFRVMALLAFLSFFIPILCVIWWWLSTLRLHRRIVHQSGGGSVLLALLLPLIAIVIVLLTCVGFVWIVGFVMLIIRSYL